MAVEIVRATVTQRSPLRVRLDGASSSSAAEQVDALPLDVGARVRVATTGSSLLVLGGASSVSTTSGWRTVHSLGTWRNGWGPYSTGDVGSGPYLPRFRKLGGVVYLTGLVSLGTFNASVFWLPPGYRPGFGSSFFVVPTVAAPARLDVWDDGDVILRSLTGSENGWVSIACSFPADA